MRILYILVCFMLLLTSIFASSPCDTIGRSGSTWSDYINCSTVSGFGADFTLFGIIILAIIAIFAYIARIPGTLALALAFASVYSLNLIANRSAQLELILGLLLIGIAIKIILGLLELGQRSD